MWEDRQLRDLKEADVRKLIESGVSEHLTLDYKRDSYVGDKGAYDFLKDVCGFANASGGIILIGVDELRDAEGQATGVPDPDAVLGVEDPNPDKTLLALDARVASCITEALRIESWPIPVEGHRHVLAIRIPDSLSKPHRVYYQGKVNFRTRRERHNDEMGVREIKELVLRTASKLEEAEAKLNERLDVGTSPEPRLFIGCIPVFWRNFSINLRDSDLVRAVSYFSLNEPPDFLSPTYTFDGLRRWIPSDSHAVVGREGLIFLHLVLPATYIEGHYEIRPTSIDFIFRRFLFRVRDIYENAKVSGPFLLKMRLQTRAGLVGVYGGGPGFDDRSALVPEAPHKFPAVQADSLADLDAIMFPICDQVHQTFGRIASPCFSPEGVWIEKKK